MLLNDNNKIFIVTSNQSANEIDPIKIFDLNGNTIKILKDSKFSTYYVYIYYDNKNSKIYILACNDYFVKSFDYNQNSIYKIYQDKEDKEEFGKYHNCLIVNDKEDLIESSINGTI